MSPSKAPVKPVTPESVKGLMVIEAALLGFLSFWMISEYLYNVNLRQSVNSTLDSNATSYAIILGIAAGLGGSIAAFTFWRNLRATRQKLERASVSPRLKGSVRHVLSTLPTMDEDTPLAQSQSASAPPEAKTPIPSGQAQPAPSQSPSAPAPMPAPNETPTATPSDHRDQSS